MSPYASPDVTPRFLLFHLHPISARLLFMRHVSGSILTPRQLPLLSSPVEEDAPEGDMALSEQLRLGVQLNEDLGFEAGMLLVDGKFRRQAEIPRGRVDLYLARFSTFDAPHDEVRARGGVLSPINELYGRHPVEMALLRWAFDYLLDT
jgi:hypothetical protein